MRADRWCRTPGERDTAVPDAGRANLDAAGADHDAGATGQPGDPTRTIVRRLADQEAQDATTERWFRIVADPSTGLRGATQFVGYIPTARAPDHFHTYDEVIYILEGEGAFHAGGATRRSAPARASSFRRAPFTVWRTPART